MVGSKFYDILTGDRDTFVSTIHISTKAKDPT